MSVALIGIDTNIIVRLLLRDDAEMYRAAHRLIENTPVNDPLIANAVAITECLWVLERRVKLAASRARKAVSDFLEAEEIHPLPVASVKDWSKMLVSPHPDISDVIISHINLDAGCEFTYTLDKRAALDVPGMKLLT